MNKVPVFVPHYLPPMSFGGCEDLAIELAALFGGALYCPREKTHDAKMVTNPGKFENVFRDRGIGEDRVLYGSDPRVPALAARASWAVSMGVYWPQVTTEGLRRFPRAPIAMVPIRERANFPTALEFLKKRGAKPVS